MTTIKDSQVSVLEELLADYISKGYKYAVWKDRLKALEALSGKGDIDIIVSDNEAFVQLASLRGFVAVNNVKLVDPSICHLLLIDSNRIFYHVHLYIELVTGSSWVKQYQCVDMSLLLNSASFWNGIYVISNEYYKQIHDFRIGIKRTSILGNYLIYFKQKEKYKRLNNENIKLFETNSLKWSRRLSRLQVLIDTVKSFLVRLIKYNSKGKDYRLVRRGGLLLVIVGRDGSGKSSLTKELINELKFLSVKKASFGRIKPIRESESISLKSKYSTLRKIAVALIRVCISVKVAVLVNFGYFVISDRWYNHNAGMDGSKLSAQSFLGKIERWIYSWVREPDIVVELRPDINTVLHRNASRNKVGKETSDEIKLRYLEFSKSDYRGRVKISLDTSTLTLARTTECVKIELAKHLNLND